MHWLARLLVTLCLLTILSTSGLRAQTSGAWPRGLVVSKDPQTSYVEAFEYLNAVPVNQYTTRYTVSGGSAHQIQNSAVVEEVRYPQSATQTISRPQIDANLSTLDSLTRRYPQYATLFAASVARLRMVPVQSLSASSPPAAASPTPGTVSTLTLRDGTRYQDVTILHTDGDRFAIRHQKGIAEVLFSDLPADSKSIPSAVQTLLSAYQDKVAKAEAERRQVQLAAASKTPSSSSILVPTMANKSELPPASPASQWPAVPSDGHKSVPFGLKIKGVSVGMDGTEAAKVLVEQGAGKLEVRPMPAFFKQAGFAIYLDANNGRTNAMIGRVVTDPRDNTVSMFIFMRVLGDLLFNTADQSAEEFAQTFINAYDVPTITPKGAGATRAWSYASSEGWTLYIYPDKTVQVMRTPDRKFD